GRRYRMAPLEYPFGRGMNLRSRFPTSTIFTGRRRGQGQPSASRLRSVGTDRVTKKRAIGSSSSSTQMAISFPSSATSAGGTSDGSFDRGRRVGKSYAVIAPSQRGGLPAQAGDLVARALVDWGRRLFRR